MTEFSPEQQPKVFMLGIDTEGRQEFGIQPQDADGYPAVISIDEIAGVAYVNILGRSGLSSPDTPSKPSPYNLALAFESFLLAPGAEINIAGLTRRAITNARERKRLPQLDDMQAEEDM